MKKKEEIYISHVLFPWETFAAQAEREKRERENGGARWTDKPSLRDTLHIKRPIYELSTVCSRSESGGGK